MTTHTTNVLEFSRSAVRLSTLGQAELGLPLCTYHEFAWPKDGDIPWHEPDEVAGWLKSCIDANNISIRSAVVCVPRTSVCLRVIELPDCSSEQIPALVSLQAESLVGEQATSVEYDFTILPRATPQSPQSALLATISKVILEGIQYVLQQIHCDPESITLGELAVPSVKSNGGSALQFYATMNSSQWDISVSQLGQTIQIQSAAYVGDVGANARSVMGLVNRIRTALPNWLREVPFDSPVLLVDADSNQPLASLEPIAQHLGYTAQTYSRAECIVRMVRAKEVRSLDFHAPCRAPDTAAIARQRWTRIALVVAGAVASVLVWGYLQSKSEQRELATLRGRVNLLRQEVSEMEPAREAYRLVQEWRENSVDWGAELSKLTERMSGKRDVYISRLEMESGNSEQLPTIRIDGLARSANDVLKLNQNFLKESDRYSIQPQGIEPSVTDPEFSSQFRLEAKVISKASSNHSLSKEEMGGTDNE